MAKSKTQGKSRKKALKSDRALLEMGEELLQAVRLQQAVQSDGVRAALGASHGDLASAVGALVSRAAERFVEESGIEREARNEFATWTEEGAEETAEAEVAAQH